MMISLLMWILHRSFRKMNHSSLELCDDDECSPSKVRLYVSLTTFNMLPSVSSVTLAFVKSCQGNAVRMLWGQSEIPSFLISWFSEASFPNLNLIENKSWHTMIQAAPLVMPCGESTTLAQVLLFLDNSGMRSVYTLCSISFPLLLPPGLGGSSSISEWFFESDNDPNYHDPIWSDYMILFNNTSARPVIWITQLCWD